jgi:predicted helicase
MDGQTVPRIGGPRSFHVGAPAISDLFVYDGSGVMAGRTWIIAPDVKSLEQRWRALRSASDDRKEALFHPHLRRGEPGDRHLNRAFQEGLPGHDHRTTSVADDENEVIPPVRYGFRSFDRQWIIPDYRLINQPNPKLWAIHSDSQVYLTSLEAHSPTSGPAISFSAAIPDLHHYKGSFGGRVYPLWADRDATLGNVAASVLALLSTRLDESVSAEDVMAYVAALAAHPAYTSRFADNLTQPGLRIPLTSDRKLFRKAVELGRRVIWLHTYGERFVEPGAGRPPGPPRVAAADAPIYSRAGAIPTSSKEMPDTIEHDSSTNRLAVGTGYIDNVPRNVWEYEVSGKHVLRHFFSYRKRNRERPLIGDRRAPSELGDIQPDHWIAEYTTDLINLLHVLRGLVAIEQQQDELLTAVCTGPLISATEVSAVRAPVTPSPGASRSPKRSRKRRVDENQKDLLD